MSKSYHYQVQYIAKDQQEQKRDTQQYRKQHNNNYDGYQRNKKYYNNRQHYQNDNKRVEYEQKYQICQPQNNVYDAKLLLSAYREYLQPPEAIVQLIKKIPQLFATKPFKPIPQNSHCNHSDEEEPQWMQDTQFNAPFQLNDIENEMQLKREQYQKDHGTFEKKQEEKRQKIEESQIKQEAMDIIEIEKQKYREKREQELKQSEAAIETKLKLIELFSSNNEPSLNPVQINHQILTVEEIEKRQLSNQTQTTNHKQEEVLQVKETCISDDELNQLLGLNNNNENSHFKTVDQLPTVLFKSEQIKTSPFSIQAQLHNKDINEPLWFYIDKSNKTQGGFPTKNMEYWYSQNYFKPNLMISWASPGKWIYLEQFQANLNLILQGTLDKLKAMDPSVVDQPKAYKPVQSNQSSSWNNQQHYVQNNNNSRYQYNNYNNQYGQQRNRNPQNRTAFQIGQKDSQQIHYNQYYYSNGNQIEQSGEGYILDPKSFPTPDEK
ncbi:unnamed protein product (macronuclear) [Paramecium tetraurelia]|uniref:GYF domain-containing protein n=1 Tax=Paramecium tetraurelia TaxID=5888 RepID=A0CSJ5_PARTE|nr:uncharacterized protein GSPATT00010034001 [Paramecium tetraurelia]CAK73762.1 unnamed protein product [Paramecium tetraurelia]|eukprot:XP_001441159.1 hypothetical protein (macronuclear) [Paramecium tetraurelia strain d4-2]